MIEFQTIWLIVSPFIWIFFGYKAGLWVQKWADKKPEPKEKTEPREVENIDYQEMMQEIRNRFPLNHLKGIIVNDPTDAAFLVEVDIHGRESLWSEKEVLIFWHSLTRNLGVVRVYENKRMRQLYESIPEAGPHVDPDFPPPLLISDPPTTAQVLEKIYQENEDLRLKEGDTFMESIQKTIGTVSAILDDANKKKKS